MALGAGFDLHIAKPFEPLELFAAIAQLLAPAGPAPAAAVPGAAERLP